MSIVDYKFDSNYVIWKYNFRTHRKFVGKNFLRTQFIIIHLREIKFSHMTK